MPHRTHSNKQEAKTFPIQSKLDASGGQTQSEESLKIEEELCCGRNEVKNAGNYRY